MYVVESLENKSYKNKIILQEINFTKKLELNNIYSVQERYHTKEIKIKINKIKQELLIEYQIIENKEIFIQVSGQSLVFYKNNILIGGGIIL